MKSVLTGDWRNTKNVEIYVPVGTALDGKLIRRNVTRVVSYCLLGRSFQDYPRHRWTGADLSIDQVGLCAAVHGLLVPAYGEFVQHLSKNKQSETAEVDGGDGDMRWLPGHRLGPTCQGAARLPGPRQRPRARRISWRRTRRSDRRHTPSSRGSPSPNLSWLGS